MNTSKPSFLIIKISDVKNAIQNYINVRELDVSLSTFLHKYMHVSPSIFWDSVHRYNKLYGIEQNVFGAITPNLLGRLHFYFEVEPIEYGADVLTAIDKSICEGAMSHINVDRRNNSLQEYSSEENDTLLMTMEVRKNKEKGTRLVFKLANSNATLIEYNVTSLNTNGLENLVSLLK